MFRININNTPDHNQLNGITKNDHHEKFTPSDHQLVDHTGLPGVPSPDTIAGYAPLDSNGKIPNTYLYIQSGGLTYSGLWDPNSASYPSNPQDEHYWLVTNNGTHDGIQYFKNDWLVYINNIEGWKHVSNTDTLISVQGQTGYVNLTLDDIPDGSIRKILQIDDNQVNISTIWSSYKINSFINNSVNAMKQYLYQYIDNRIDNLNNPVNSVNGKQGIVELQLSDLTDVDLDGIQNGQVLKWNGQKFIPAEDNTI